MRLVGRTRNRSLLSSPRFHKFLLFRRRPGTRRPLSSLRIIVRWLKGFRRRPFLQGQEGLVRLWGCFSIRMVHLRVVREDLVCYESVEFGRNHIHSSNCNSLSLADRHYHSQCFFLDKQGFLMQEMRCNIAI